jgi:hypothetical protein
MDGYKTKSQYYGAQFMKQRTELQNERLQIIVQLKDFYKTELTLPIHFQFNITEPKFICKLKEEFLRNLRIIEHLEYMSAIIEKQTAFCEMYEKNPEMAKKFLDTKEGPENPVFQSLKPQQEEVISKPKNKIK